MPETEVSMQAKGPTVMILHGSQGGNAKRFAYDISRRLLKRRLAAVVRNMSQVDPEDLCIHECIVCVLSTYSGGSAPESARFFCQWLREAVDDSRIDSDFLSNTRFAVIGLGDSAYEEDYNVAAKDLNRSLRKLGGKQMLPLTLVDKGLSEDDFEELMASLESCCQNKSLQVTAVDSEDEEVVDDALADLEELGNIMVTHKRSSKTPPKMLTSTMRNSLTKQGYKIIGSHSGVKICRWTKAQLRGRGGCYKHTMYGIMSYQCMEMTPSLACANKCVFCWRHHTNPVGKEWKWQMDQPELILEKALENHCRMIKQMRGVPGVIPQRFEDAFNVRHCALSLVGEPIMYPEINRLVSLMHNRAISTFLVTNAQFPDAIRQLVPVTQLYISIDASTKESLKAVDQPLHSDFWERFLDSIDAIRECKQRTVFRLTLLKGSNMDDDMSRYAELVRRGQPDFIEVKGVTFCGTSDASTLTMKHVPFHHEVRAFCEALCEKVGGSQYNLSCEHAHSCCVLIAHNKFYSNDRWHTWIDYDRFNQLVLSGESFTSLDYAAETPPWAHYGSEEKGFDPIDTRWYRNKTKKKIQASEKPSEAQATDMRT